MLTVILRSSGGKMGESPLTSSPLASVGPELFRGMQRHPRMGGKTAHSTKNTIADALWAKVGSYPAHIECDSPLNMLSPSACRLLSSAVTAGHGPSVPRDGTGTGTGPPAPLERRTPARNSFKQRGRCARRGWDVRPFLWGLLLQFPRSLGPWSIPRNAPPPVRKKTQQRAHPAERAPTHHTLNKPIPRIVSPQTPPHGTAQRVPRS